MRIRPRRDAGAGRREEFNTFAQAALHHLRAGDHLSHDGGDLARPEVELTVEILNGFEDLGVTEMRIAQRRDLRPFLGQEGRLPRCVASRSSFA